LFGLSHIAPGSRLAGSSIVVFELRTLRPANFVNRDNRQHGKDGKPYRHWAGLQQGLIVSPDRAAFGAQIVLIGLELWAPRGLTNGHGLMQKLPQMRAG
jgi:hypothetical protein